MKKLLFGVILGLFAFVHSSPLTTVTQIPAKAEDDVLKEAATDGFLIDTPSLSKESQMPHTAAPVPELPSIDPSQMIFEGSGLGDQQDEGEDRENKTQSASHAPTSTVSPTVADEPNPEKTTTQSSGESVDVDKQQGDEPHTNTTQSVPDGPSLTLTSTESPKVTENSSSSITQSQGGSFDVDKQHEDEPRTNTTQSVSDGPSLTLTSTESPKVTENSSSSITQSQGESFDHDGEHQGTHAPSLNTTMVQGIMDNSGSTNTNSSRMSFEWPLHHDDEDIRTPTQSVSEAPGQDTTAFVRAVDHSSSSSSDTLGSEDSSDSPQQPDGEHQETTTPSVSHAPGQDSNVPLPGNDDQTSHPASTPSQNNDLLNNPPVSTPSSEPEDNLLYTVSMLDPLYSDGGSGDDERPDQDTETPPSETSTTSATMAPPFKPKVPRIIVQPGYAAAPGVSSEGGESNVEDISELPSEAGGENGGDSGNQEPHTDETSQEGHKTPGWMIIVGFIVGVAALIVLCVAIATRDKWNKPNKPTIFETQVSTTNQPREQEMETFLPRENGKASEYTVIPLEELPDKYSSD